MHRTLEELESGLGFVRLAPADDGLVSMIVRRPRKGEREVLGEGKLDPVCGLVGDDWATRGSSHTADGASNPDQQVTLMSSRVIELLAGDERERALAGDQLYVDLDLGADNLPAGTRLAIDEAILEITAQPHTGCKKFGERYGVDALKFVNSPQGRHARLRGVNARVVRGGTVRVRSRVRRA